MHTTQSSDKLHVSYVPLSSLRHPERNPRAWSKEATAQLEESIKRHGLVDPLIVNSAAGREGVIVGGNFRYEVAKAMGFEEVPVVQVNIPDLKKEEELIIRLNKNTGEFDLCLLAEFDESLLKDIGFTSEDLDDIFPEEESPEVFDIQKELEKLKISTIEIKEGDVYGLGDSRLMCGDSMQREDVQKLMGEERADMCFTDPPYILDYLHGKKKHGEATEGFGLKRDRRYIGTDSLPDNFTEL